MLRKVGLFAAGVAATTTAKLLDVDLINAEFQMMLTLNGPQFGCTVSDPRIEEEREQRLAIGNGALIFFILMIAVVMIASECTYRRRP